MYVGRIWMRRSPPYPQVKMTVLSKNSSDMSYLVLNVETGYFWVFSFYHVFTKSRFH